MRLYKETTIDWAVPVKNHTYLLSDNKEWLYGIVRAGTRDLEMLSSRIKFSTSRRTIKLVRNKDDI
jgi:hypothetical protein